MALLHRVDPSKNMARFYALSLQRSLFGEVLLVRCWGRIGAQGRLRSDWFDTECAALEALDRLKKSKAKRGYEAPGRLT